MLHDFCYIIDIYRGHVVVELEIIYSSNASMEL